MYDESPSAKIIAELRALTFRTQLTHCVTSPTPHHHQLVRTIEALLLLLIIWTLPEV